MVNIHDIPELQDCLSTLKETSIDKHDQQSLYYLTESQIEAVDFDAVKEAYVKPLGLEESPKSNDALLDTGHEFMEFIEFKAGVIQGDRGKQFGLRKKIYDSMLIYMDITSEKLSDIRQYMDYVLVYRDSKNPARDSDDIRTTTSSSEDKYAVQDSASQTSIAKTLIGYGKKEFVQFGLNIFKGYCFRDVHTYTEQEFAAHLDMLLQVKTLAMKNARGERDVR